MEKQAVGFDVGMGWIESEGDAGKGEGRMKAGIDGETGMMERHREEEALGWIE